MLLVAFGANALSGVNLAIYFSAVQEGSDTIELYKTKLTIFSQMRTSDLLQAWRFASRMTFRESRLHYPGRHIATASNGESDRSQVYSNDLWATTHVAGAL